MSTNSIASHFGRALPTARLTTHDPRLVQVITTPSSHLARADFGLKSPLRAAVAPGSKRGSVRYVQVKEQDRSDVGSAGAGGGSATANWREREHEVMLLKRWVEAGVAVRLPHEDQIGYSNSNGGGGAASASSTSSYSSNKDEVAAQNPPLPVSRFDRGSRRPLPTDSAAATTTDDDAAMDHEKAAAELLSKASTRYSSTAARMPNYLMLPERDFERLLDAIREHRADFLRGLYTALAERVREDKLQAACEAYDAQPEGTANKGERPTLANFPLEEEIAELKRQQSHGGGVTNDQEVDSERLLVDMFDLARSRVASVEASAYLRRFLSARGLTDGDPSSTQLPDVDVRVNGRHSSAEGAAAVNGGARLHPLGGLQYSKPDKIFSATLAPALPGRVISMRGRSGRSSSALSSSSSPSSSSSSSTAGADQLLVASGSRVYNARTAYARGASMYEPSGQNTRQGAYLWRLYDAKLEANDPSESSLIERKIADTKATWDMERGWSLKHLGLGYVRAHAREVLADEIKKNGYAASISGNKAFTDAAKESGANAEVAAAAAAAAAAWNRMPGSPAWVGDRSESEHEDANRAATRLTSGVRAGSAYGGGGGYFRGGGRRDVSPSSSSYINGNGNAGERHGRLSGELAAYAPRGGNRVNVTRSAAQRRSAALYGGLQEEGGEGEGEGKGKSYEDDVSTLLGLGGDEKRGGK